MSKLSSDQNQNQKIAVHKDSVFGQKIFLTRLGLASRRLLSQCDARKNVVLSG